MKKPIGITKNICFVGGNSSGKTSQASFLARRIGVPFYDIDALVEEKTQKHIDDFIVESGFEALRELEFELIKTLLEQGQCFILAVGGGTLLYQKSRGLVQENCSTLYLACNPDTLYARTIQRADRFLVKDWSEEFFIAEFKKRELFYTGSDFIIDATGNLSETMEHVWWTLIEHTILHWPYEFWFRSTWEEHIKTNSIISFCRPGSRKNLIQEKSLDGACAIRILQKESTEKELAKLSGFYEDATITQLYETSIGELGEDFFENSPTFLKTKEQIQEDLEGIYKRPFTGTDVVTIVTVSKIN
jgi:shikimate kinase